MPPPKLPCILGNGRVVVFYGDMTIVDCNEEGVHTDCGTGAKLADVTAVACRFVSSGGVVINARNDGRAVFEVADERMVIAGLEICWEDKFAVFQDLGQIRFRDGSHVVICDGKVFLWFDGEGMLGVRHVEPGLIVTSRNVHTSTTVDRYV